jgi:hypothetical protein
MEQWEEAATDAKQAVKLKPNWPKVLLERVHV